MVRTPFLRAIELQRRGTERLPMQARLHKLKDAAVP
jgi:hypothetical protein